MLKRSKQILVILGSARGDGHTHQLVTSCLKGIPYELIDLLDFNIEPYNYYEKYGPKDQFQDVVLKMAQADLIVFATPVYWYSMSAQLKLFFDRMTNLTDLYKPIGKSLKGKQTALISVGSSEHLPDGFLVPFADTAAYFDMQFNGFVYQSSKSIGFPNSEPAIRDIIFPE